MSNLTAFIDQFILTPERFSFTEEDLLKRFFRQQLLKKRALSFHEESSELKQMIKGLKKKIEF